MRLLPPAESRHLEREYLEHRRAVLGMLHTEFGGLEDHEELYQEAWTEALELRARGEHVDNLRGLLITIAWRRARDRLRNHKPELVEPDSGTLTFQVDPGPSPDEEMEIRLEAAAVRDVIDALEPRQAAALKLRFDWHLETEEIQRRLGVSPKRLEKIFSDAYQRIRERLSSDARGESEWTRRQRSLLLACEVGAATPAQRARAQRLVNRDPVCRGMLREMRATLEQLGAAIPLPAVVSDDRVRPVVILRERVADALAPLKEHVDGLFTRAGAHASAIEQAGAGATGMGAGSAVKVALACLTLGAGGATVCIKTGVLGPSGPKAHHAPRPHAERPKRKPAKTTPVASVRPAVTPLPTRTTPRKRVHRQSASKAPSPTGRPAPLPAPKGSTEFGPGSIGSTSRPQQPAAAPTTGGGEFTP